MVTTTAKTARAKGATGRVQRECPLCGCTELDYEFIVENCPLCCCQECSLSFLNPQPRRDEPCGAEFLEAGEGIYEVHAENARARLDQFISYAGVLSGRLLLVGAGKSLQAEAVRRGFEVICVSPE